MKHGIESRLLGYCRWLRHEWRQYRYAAVMRRKRQIFETWLNHLRAHPPEVLLGANFAKFGGVRHHLQAIENHSSLNVALAPSERVLREVGAHFVANDFAESFQALELRGLRVVHSHVYPWYIDWSQAQQAKGLRWVHTYHSFYYPDNVTGELEPWQQEINHTLLTVARQADVCLSVSKWQTEELRLQHGITAHYLPNGVDVTLCDTANARSFVRKTGLRNFVLYVGRNDPVKNPIEFVQLARRLRGQQFVMIGGGLDKNCLRNDWDIDPPENLTMLGAIPHRQVLDALAACSVLVVTSKREGLPTLVMEAMALGKEVVVPDVAGCVEVVGGGAAGHIYQLGDIDQLAGQTLGAMQQQTLGSCAREKVLREYDWRVIAPQLDAIYRAA